jgi:hypothetical protein
MYIVPLAVIIFLALVAVAWSPIFAIIAFAVFFLLFLAYMGLARSADRSGETPGARAAERGRREEAETRIR